MVRQEWKKLFHNKILLLVVIAVIAIPSIYTTLFLGSMWDPYGKADKLPVAVVNHVTGEQEMFVQDSSCRVYLVNDAGRVLWTYPLEEAINSEVYQVDLYKNGKILLGENEVRLCAGKGKSRHGRG